RNSSFAKRKAHDKQATGSSFGADQAKARRLLHPRARVEEGFSDGRVALSEVGWEPDFHRLSAPAWALGASARRGRADLRARCRSGFFERYQRAEHFPARVP